MYAPAMRYSLPAMAVDEEKLDLIQSKIIPTIVQQLGLNRNLATAVRYGPTSLGGLGLMERGSGNDQIFPSFSVQKLPGGQASSVLSPNLSTRIGHSKSAARRDGHCYPIPHANVGAVDEAVYV